MAGILSDFLRDAVSAIPGGACCKGAPEWVCTDTSPGDCLDDPDALFYPGLQCSEVQCGTEACCRETACNNEKPDFDLTDPNSGCLGGILQGPGTQCASNPCDAPEPPDERPEGCMTEPRAKPRAPGGFTWNTDLCQNAQFRITIRPAHEWPRSAEARKWVNLGYGEPVSVGPIRAVETASGVEPCRRHYAKMILTPDGYARMAMCSQHVLGDPESLLVSEGRLYLENDSIRPKPVRDRIDNGYAAFALSHRAPFWVEAIYHSQPVYCGGIV